MALNTVSTRGFRVERERAPCLRRTSVLAALLTIGCGAPVAEEARYEWPSIEDEREEAEWSRVLEHERVEGHTNPFSSLLDLDSVSLRQRLGPPHGWSRGGRYHGPDPLTYGMSWEGPCPEGERFRLALILRPRSPGAPPLEWRSVVVMLHRGCDGRRDLTSDISGYTGPFRAVSLRL